MSNGIYKLYELKPNSVALNLTNNANNVTLCKKLSKAILIILYKLICTKVYFQCIAISVENLCTEFMI